jgi:hypothetical protein
LIEKSPILAEIVDQKIARVLADVIDDGIVLIGSGAGGG